MPYVEVELVQLCCPCRLGTTARSVKELLEPLLQKLSRGRCYIVEAWKLEEVLSIQMSRVNHGSTIQYSTSLPGLMPHVLPYPIFHEADKLLILRQVLEIELVFQVWDNVQVWQVED